MPSIWSALATALLAFSHLSLATESETDTDSYDYIIVGAGTCGLLLANRLSRDANISVAVVDPGADQRQNPNVTGPFGWGVLAQTAVNWNYSSTPQANANGRVIEYDAGKGIGGTSLINGMTYIRGDKAQFDAWEDLGNSGWNWDTMLKYYKKVERFFPPESWQTAVGASFEQEYHGLSGDLHVGFNRLLVKGSVYDSVKTSWAAIGQGLNRDMNSGNTAGFGVWPQTLDPDKNVRWDSATAFYWPVQDRQNLKLHNGTVSRILWKSASQGKAAEASGVEYFTPENQRRTLTAKREVIVSAGALRTPLVLELSGIGNPRLLERMGIETVVDSPGVGENMIDQPNNGLIWLSKGNYFGYGPYATFVNASHLFGTEVASIAASTRASLSRWAHQVATFSDGALNAPAVEHLFRIQHDLIFGKGVTLAEIISSAGGSNAASYYWVLLPFSRGSVHLSTSGDMSKPSINPRFLSVDFDLSVQVATGRLSARVWQTPPASDLVAAPLRPNATELPSNATDAQWRRFTTDTLKSNAHSLGTAAMMARELGGVVDAELRVYGTRNVRVVDASVLPMQFSGHLTATLYAVAERAAEMIKAG